MTYLILFYIAGFVISAIKSFYAFSSFTILAQETNNDLLKRRPDIKVYFIIKPILWPYFFLTEKSPLERLSECFFSHYGDKGHTYFGSQGLKNFLNDFFRGKNRYKNYKTKKVMWLVDKNSEEYQEFIKHRGRSECELKATITCATYKNKYLLQVVFSEGECQDSSAEISRFDLDRSESLDEGTFKNKLLKIHKEGAKDLVKALNI